MGKYAARGKTAGVVVLQDSHGRLCELVDKFYGGVYVEDVVVGYFFAVELCEHAIEIAAEHGFLVWVLSVAQ